MRNDLIDNIRMNINSEQVRACVYVRAGDTRARTLHFTLVEEGKVVDLTDLVIAELVIMKPDGNECDQSMTRYGNELHYTLRTQDINVPGDNRAQIQLTFSDGTVYESPEFSIMVYDKLDPRYETSTNEYTALNAKLAMVEQAYDDIVQIQLDVTDMRDDTQSFMSDASAYATISESWAVGGTGARPGEDTNNSKYWSDQAQAAVSNVVNSFNGRQGVVTPESGDYSIGQISATGTLGQVPMLNSDGDLEMGTITVPTALSDLTDDATHRLVTDTEKSTWNGKQDALTAGTNITISSGTISATDTTYTDATQLASGLMSASDKTKLDGIASGADSVSWTQTVVSGTKIAEIDINGTSTDVYAPNGGGGGGHTIVTPDGTMTQRSNLNFTDAHGTDDSVNDETEITVFKEIQQADFDLLTPTEQTTGGYIITDANPSYIPADNCVSVTADGTKTYTQLFDALYALIDKTKMSRNAVLKWLRTNGAVYWYWLSYSTDSRFIFSYVLETTATDIREVDLQASGSMYRFSYLTNTITHYDQSSDPVDAGTVFTVYYNIVAAPEIEESYVVENKATTNISINANSFASSTTDITKAGYTPISVCTFYGSNSYAIPVRWYFSGNNLIIAFYNLATSALSTVSPSVGILYKKN